MGDRRLRIEEIAYGDLLRYEFLYHRERMPVRFEDDEDADWEYLDYRFHVALWSGRPAGFSGTALTRRTPGTGPSSVYLRSSYTLEAYRNRGVWSALWAHKLREISRLGWVSPSTEIWGLARTGDLRFVRRGFHLEDCVSHRYKGHWERYHQWIARWADLVRHPANRSRPDQNVQLHP